jgi:peptidoglycan-associated lipoprotein
MNRKKSLVGIVAAALIAAGAFGCGGKATKTAAAPPPAEKAPPPPPPPPAPPRAPVAPSDEEEWFRNATVEELQGRLQDIFFEYDRSDLKPEAKSALEQNTAWLLKSFNTLVIEVEGHCDERGTMAYNLALGDRRAGSVASYLLSRGLPQSRLKTISYGKERPQCTSSAENCWWKNRRAHFRVAGKGDARSGE